MDTGMQHAWHVIEFHARRLGYKSPPRTVEELMPKRTTDLEDADSPLDVASILRQAADKYRESHGELQSAWQDEHAGAIWVQLAAILDRAAQSAENAVNKWYTVTERPIVKKHRLMPRQFRPKRGRD